MRLTLDMLGARYTYVTGYNSSAQAMIALQRGEISYYADSPPLYKTKIEPQVKDGTLIPVFYDPNFDGKDFSVPAYMKDYAIPPFHELYKIDQRHDAERPALGAVQVHAAGQRHHVPDDRRCRRAPRSDAVNALRAAVVKLAADKSYIEEAIKVMGDAPEYVTSADAQRRRPRRADDQPGAQGVHGRLWQTGGKIVSDPYLICRSIPLAHYRVGAGCYSH